MALCETGHAVDFYQLKDFFERARSIHLMKNVLLLVDMLMLGTVAPSEIDRQFIAGDLDYLVSFYKSLHQSPELSRQEQNTAKKLADELREIGFEATESAGGYSVVGIMKNGEGPRALYRTDMDALPMWEQPRRGFQHRRDFIDFRLSAFSTDEMVGTVLPQGLWATDLGRAASFRP